LPATDLPRILRIFQLFEPDFKSYSQNELLGRENQRTKDLRGHCPRTDLFGPEGSRRQVSGGQKLLRLQVRESQRQSAELRSHRPRGQKGLPPASAVPRQRGAVLGQVPSQAAKGRSSQNGEGDFQEGAHFLRLRHAQSFAVFAIPSLQGVLFDSLIHEKKNSCTNSLKFKLNDTVIH